MKGNFPGSSRRAFLEWNYPMTSKKLLTSFAPMPKTSNSPNLLSSPCHMHLSSPTQNGPMSSSEPWSTSIMSSQGLLPSPMTTGMSKLLERSNSSLVPPEQAKCQETGSSHEICTQKLPHLLSLTDSMNYRLTGNTSLGFSLPSQSETTLTFSCLTRLCKSKLENDATSFSQILWNLTTYASTGSTRSAQEIPARPNPKLISKVRCLTNNGIEGCAM